MSTKSRHLHFRALAEFEADDQDAIIELIVAMIIKRKVEGAVQPFERTASGSRG